MIFADAEAENMTGEGYAWIVTEQVERTFKVVDVWLEKNLRKIDIYLKNG